MRANYKSTALAVLGVASLAIAVPMSIANAQDPGQRDQRTDQRLQRDLRSDQRPDQPFQRRGGLPGQAPGGMQGMMGRIGGGGTAITQDGVYLYIVQGGQVYKVTKKDLEVVAVGRLPVGPGGPGMDRPPRPGEPGQRRQRGGGAPPPDGLENPLDPPID